MSIIQAYGSGLFIILAIMFILWLASLALKNASIVDIFWGSGFVITNWIYFELNPYTTRIVKIRAGG